jgi:integrase
MVIRVIERGMDVKTLSEILGHEDITTTLNLYVHSSEETKMKSWMICSNLIFKLAARLIKNSIGVGLV